MHMGQEGDHREGQGADGGGHRVQAVAHSAENLQALALHQLRAQNAHQFKSHRLPSIKPQRPGHSACGSPLSLEGLYTRGIRQRHGQGSSHGRPVFSRSWKVEREYGSEVW